MRGYIFIEGYEEFRFVYKEIPVFINYSHTLPSVMKMND